MLNCFRHEDNQNKGIIKHNEGIHIMTYGMLIHPAKPHNQIPVKIVNKMRPRRFRHVYWDHILQTTLYKLHQTMELN
jgi:hypothetical protein